MSSFDFFDDRAPSKQNNLEQVVNNFVNGDSFQFDQFDNVDQNKADHSKSFNSDFFNTEPKQEEPVFDKGVSAKSQGKNESFDFDNSRHLSEISYMNGQSFHYEQPAPPPKTQSNDRYTKLQSMLSQAKKNNLDNFYRNLDQQNTYKVQDKFNNKAQFNNYKNELKSYKREREDDFKGKYGNYNFKNNNYTIPERDSGNPFAQTEKKDFRKKSMQSQSQQSQQNNSQKQVDFFGGDNLLPKQYEKEDDDFDFFEMGQEQIKKEVQQYEEKQYKKEAQQFFTQEQKQKQKKKRLKSQEYLSEIREQRPNLFELTHQQQKMTTLLQNYQQMKTNFHDLMKNLKNTNTDQQKIITQLKNIKHQYESKQSRIKMQHQSKEQKRQMKEREKEEKQRKMNQIREQIERAKESGDKDLMFVKINQKIQSLESIVRNAITEMNTQKEQKFVPKIINYYQEEQPHRSSRSRTNRSNLGFSRQEGGPNQQDISRSRTQINDLEDQLAPVRNMINELKEERSNQMLYNIDDFSSPLQLDLTTQQFPMNLSRDRSQQLDVAFVPPEDAKHYIPNTLDPTNKYLRRCLTQKSSIIYESFQFYVTGKFLMTGADRSPVLCQVRVANKCAISLYDVFVVVFGPQAQQGQLQMRPPKVMYDEFKQNTSFLFEVDLSKICLQSGGFSIMISYKTDSVNKKKVVFKVVLPFVQLIKPQFIYDEQFTSGWNHMSNELYVNPQTLDFKTIRSHEDLKLILPFIQVTENDPNAFAYGIMFHYPTSTTAFMLKVVCYVNGRASLHLKSSALTSGDKRLREEILDIMNFLCFG